MKSTSLRTNCLLRYAFILPLVTAAITTLSSQNKPAQEKAFAFVDLQACANQKLTDSLHGFKGNDLAELPKGDHTFGGVKFRIEGSYIGLGSSVDPEKPKEVKGIKLEKLVSKLHFLHGTGFGAYGNAGDPLFVADDTLIGEYKINYEDKSTVSIPIVYGKDVRDWWNWDKPVEVSRGKVAWNGENAFAKQMKKQIHLYLATWENPKPATKVLSVDYISTGGSAGVPFCIAITTERN
jgi:hypothetical protein